MPFWFFLYLLSFKARPQPVYQPVIIQQLVISAPIVPAPCPGCPIPPPQPCVIIPGHPAYPPFPTKGLVIPAVPDGFASP